MSRRFEEKVCLVSGAGSGIGQETALAFAREGGKVVVADIEREGGWATAQAIHKLGGEASYVQVDISSMTDAERMVRHAVEQYGGLDYAVNCAAITGGLSSLTHQYPDDRWHRVLSVNLTGTWYCIKQQIAQMLRQGGGAIVNVASAAGLKGHPGNVPYAASKHGVIGLTKTAALEYATSQIRINAICPTSIETPMIMDGRLNLRNNPELLEQFTNYQAMKRMGRPEEVASVVLWLCSEEASFITGHAMPVDGGAFAK